MQSPLLDHQLEYFLVKRFKGVPQSLEFTGTRLGDARNVCPGGRSIGHGLRNDGNAPITTYWTSNLLKNYNYRFCF